MKTRCLQLFLLGLLSLIGPAKSSAETLRMVIINDRVTATVALRSDAQVIADGIKKVFKKHYWPFGDGHKASRGGKITAIVFLALGVVVFGLCGISVLAATILEWYFFGTTFALFLLLFSVVSMTLSILCVRGIFKTARKLHRMKTGEEPVPEEKFVPRPPSKNLKQQ